VASFEAIEKIASPRYLLEFLATIRENLPTRLHEEPKEKYGCCDEPLPHEPSSAMNAYGVAGVDVVLTCAFIVA
jgi:hypothetical protein